MFFSRMSSLLLVVLVAMGMSACSGTSAPVENTPSTVTGDLNTTVFDSNDTLTGDLNITDVDDNEAGFVAETFVGKYGILTIEENGNWKFERTAELGVGEENATEVFTVKTLGEDEVPLEITIKNNPASFEELETKDGLPGEKYLEGTITDPEGIKTITIVYTDKNGNYIDTSTYNDGNIDSENSYSVGTTYEITVADKKEISSFQKGIL